MHGGDRSEPHGGNIQKSIIIYNNYFDFYKGHKNQNISNLVV